MTSSSPITVQEASIRLRVSEDTIRARIREGRLHAHRVGRRLLLNVAEVEALIEEVRP
jgi:excisionase family DNA binding protein